MLTMSLGRTSGTTLQHISLLWRLELLSLLPMVSLVSLKYIHIFRIGVAPPPLVVPPRKDLRCDQSSGSNSITSNMGLNPVISSLSYALLLVGVDLVPQTLVFSFSSSLHAAVDSVVNMQSLSVFN